MKTNRKKLLSLFMAVILVMGLAVPALAGEAAPSGAEGGNSGKVQITKKLKIGRGITIPSETFYYTFENATLADAEKIGETSGFIDQDATQHGTTYPTLDPAQVIYEPDMRKAGSTDTELTYMTEVIDLTAKTWPASGLYVYSVKETAGNTEGMTYDSQVYYLKVYVQNDGKGGNEVYSATVMGWDEAQQKWVKKDGAPNDNKEPGSSEENDGCDDLEGNEFCFTNVYSKLVDRHPVNENDPTVEGDEQLPGDNAHSNWAFKMTKKVEGSFANANSAFDFKVSVVLPDTFTDKTYVMTARVNGYTAHQLDETIPESDGLVSVSFPLDGGEKDIYLKHGDAFGIEKLPAGTVIHVEELARTGEKYVPTYSGKWGLDVSTPKTGNGGKGGNLEAKNIVVGEHGAYIQFTNTLNNSDITPTGIVISNLPYILMVGIALAGIGFYSVGKKRRRG